MHKVTKAQEEEDKVPVAKTITGRNAWKQRRNSTGPRQECTASTASRNAKKESGTAPGAHDSPPRTWDGRD
eukprot:1498251-Heterocapsa_arctica.AAC.1